MAKFVDMHVEATRKLADRLEIGSEWQTLGERAISMNFQSLLLQYLCVLD